MKKILLISCALILAGCQIRTDAEVEADKARYKAIADSSATIWEAAHAIQAGAPSQAPAQAIKENAAAIIKVSGHTYEPAGVRKEIK